MNNWPVTPSGRATLMSNVHVLYTTTILCPQVFVFLLLSPSSRFNKGAVVTWTGKCLYDRQPKNYLPLVETGSRRKVELRAGTLECLSAMHPRNFFPRPVNLKSVCILKYPGSQCTIVPLYRERTASCRLGSTETPYTSLLSKATVILLAVGFNGTQWLLV